MTESSSEREILTIEEAAQLLRVSVKTFNKVLHSQSIPARKIGREWKFSRRALIDWIGAGRSDEFYRESKSARAAGAKGTIPARAPERPVGPSPRSLREETERRTTGWSLELD